MATKKPRKTAKAKSAKTAKTNPAWSTGLGGFAPAKTKTAKAKTAKAKAVKTTAPAAGRETKQDMLLAMLRAPEGTTIPAMMKAADWLAHTTRAFLSAVVRKKLGLNVTVDKSEGGGDRIYRIA